MDSAMEMDDPFDWSVEQVVATLSDQNSPWLQVNASSVVPDLDALAKGLRDNLINGITLLTTVNDNVLREDLGLRALGHRAFVSRVIRTLRNKSVKFREQELETGMHTPIPSLQSGISDTARSPPFSGFPPFSPQAMPIHPHLYEHSTIKNLPDNTTSQAALHRTSSPMSFSLERDHQLLGQQPTEDFSRPRFLGFAPSEFNRLKFGSTQRGSTIDSQESSVTYQQALDASSNQPGQSMVFRDINSQKGAAPTPTSKGIMLLEQKASPNSVLVAEKTVIDAKERKRLAPTLVVQESMDSLSGGKPPLNQVASRDFGGVRAPFGSQNRASLVRRFPNPYLGIKKIPVDDLFFGDARMGQELQDGTEDEDNFVITSVARMSNGCRLYVNKLVKHYLFKPVQITYSRNGKICHAVQPYSAKILQMLPNQRTQSFILFSPSGGGFRVTRENMAHWPDVSTDGTLIENTSADSSNTASNPLALSQEDDGNHDWDFLLKWQHTGSDIIPAQLGGSGSEGEYDLDTWNEIEQEHGPLGETMGGVARRTLQEDEVNKAIDDGINGLIAKWELEKLPKRELKAWSIWKKSRREGTKRFQIREAQYRIDHINETRLGKMRREIATEIWTKAAAVRKQCGIMEQSVFDREDLKWTISLLERKREPRRPPPRPKREKEPKVIRQLYFDDEEDVEVLGSGTDGFESGWDGNELSDFIIDDGVQGTGNVEDADTEMADVEDAEAESTDEELALRERRKSSAGNSSDNPIRSTDDDGDIPMSGLPMASENVASILMTAASSPLSPARTLTSPNVTLPSTPTKDKSTYMPQLKTTFPQHQQNSFIDLTLSDPVESPNPFRGRRKDPSHSQDVSRVVKSPTKGSKAIDASEGVVDLAASTDDDLRYNPLKDASVETLEKRGDRRRLMVCIVGGGMDDHKRRLLAVRLAKQSQSALRHDSIAGIDALSRGFGTAFAQGSDDNSTVMRLTRLYLCWLQCKRQRWDEKPSPQLLRLAESKKAFSLFRRLLREVLRQYEPALFEDIPVDYNTDADRPPPPKKTKTARLERVNVVAHGYERDMIEGSSPHKKRKRPVFENLGAKTTRENDRQRLRDQEQRRSQLERRLAKMGTTFADDPSRVVINTGKFEDQELIFLNEHIGRRIKPHQIEGVQFMWRELVMDEKSLQGCLLAHTMGLGKTLQVITLLVTIAEAARSTNPDISNQIPPSLRQPRSLILCPPSLIDNWWDELLMWAPQPMENNIGQLRRVDSSMTNLARRRSEIGAWYEEGGVLLMSYEIFRNFVLNMRTRKSKAPLLSEAQHKILKRELLDGPNIIVADEAHRLKNTATSTAIAAAQLKSRSRIALTGSPLANNLEEYYSMIDWVAPGYLGPLVEFKAKYVEPIQDGLYSDSSLLERRQCLKMLRVLKSDLDPKVNRADISVLKGSLPPKTEFLIKVSLTKVQEDAYKRYVQAMLSGSNGDVGNTCLWDWLTILSLLCNHPLCFKNKLLERDRKDTSQGNPAQTSAETSDEDTVEDGQVELEPGDAPVSSVGMTPAIIKQQISALDRLGKRLNSIVHSHRAIILNEILDASIKAGDKVLVFSHSIPTLDYIEDLLKNGNRRYSRLDGSTKMSERQKATKAFNLNNLDVYLISTRTGGMGLNLYGANRVIIFDFSFNPTWEEQAVGRAYRIGQRKPVFVYRFMSAGTFEEVIQNKAVFKMQLASRVVDKKNPTRYAMKKARDYLFEPKAVGQKDLSEFKGKDPKVLDKVLAAHKGCVTSIELTETFHRDDDDKLTAEEEREADQLLRDEQLKRADPEAYSKMIGDRQRAAIAKAHAKKALTGSHLAPSPHPLSTTSSREKIRASPKVVESSAPIETSFSSMIKAKVALEPSHTSSRFQTPANLGPLAAERSAPLNPAGGESSSAIDEHPTTPRANGVEIPDSNPSVSPFIRAFLEDEKRRDISGR